MVLYLAYKLLRKDFVYWIRADGVTQHIVSITIRMVSKIVVDFSGMLHMRHPFELGGR